MYKRQLLNSLEEATASGVFTQKTLASISTVSVESDARSACLLYTSDAADERSSVDLGGRRIIKKKNRGALA